MAMRTTSHHNIYFSERRRLRLAASRSSPWNHAELLLAVELARICSVSTRFYRYAATLAFASVRAQHGLMIPDASLAEKALRTARSAARS